MSMTIGAVARAAGVGVETIRYYERCGLLAPPPRSPAGYRHYPPETVDRIAAYKRLQRLGFTLGEAAELLALQGKPERCEVVKQRATAKVAAIEERMAALVAVRDELLALVARFDAACTPTSCTVLLAPQHVRQRRAGATVNDTGVWLVGGLTVLTCPLFPVAGAVARWLPWRTLVAKLRHANPWRV